MPPLFDHIAGSKIAGLNRSTRPRPEFWMPVSMVNVLLSLYGILKSELVPKPIPKARRLCTNTIRKMYLMHFMKASRLLPNVSTTIAMKNATERYCIGFFSLAVTLGRYCEHKMPSTSGIPRRMTIVLKISQKGISNSGRSILFSAKFRYILPQKEKLSGVVKIHAAVLKAVSDTDSSVLPRESEVMKLEMFPPGHDATRIIPSAIIGESQFLKVIVSRKVSAGKRISWHMIPRKTDCGFFAISTNVLGLIPSATPNITKARTIFIVFMPASFILTFIASRCAITSGLI